MAARAIAGTGMYTQVQIRITSTHRIATTNIRLMEYEPRSRIYAIPHLAALMLTEAASECINRLGQTCAP